MVGSLYVILLEAQIPDEPFPHLNKKEDIHRMVKTIIKEASKNSG